MVATGEDLFSYNAELLTHTESRATGDGVADYLNLGSLDGWTYYMIGDKEACDRCNGVLWDFAKFSKAWIYYHPETGWLTGEEKRSRPFGWTKTVRHILNMGGCWRDD